MVRTSTGAQEAIQRQCQEARVRKLQVRTTAVPRMNVVLVQQRVQDHSSRFNLVLVAADAVVPSQSIDSELLLHGW